MARCIVLEFLYQYILYGQVCGFYTNVHFMAMCVVFIQAYTLWPGV